MKRAAIVLVFLVACGGSGWTDAQREEFIAGCQSQAPEDFTDEQRAQLDGLCVCAADKAEEEGVSDPNEIDEETMTEWATECAEE